MLEIALLKRKARKAYEKYYDLVGDMSCGRSIAEVVSVRVSEAKRDFNEAMEKLSKLDPHCPKQRL